MGRLVVDEVGCSEGGEPGWEVPFEGVMTRGLGLELVVLLLLAGMDEVMCFFSRFGKPKALRRALTESMCEDARCGRGKEFKRKKEKVEREKEKMKEEKRRKKGKCLDTKGGGK